MVDIVLTSEQLAAIRKASGSVHFVTSARELVCVSQLSDVRQDETEFQVSGECEPLKAAEIEELARRTALGNVDGLTTEELLKRLEQRRAS